MPDGCESRTAEAEKPAENTLPQAGKGAVAAGRWKIVERLNRSRDASPQM